MDLAPSLQSQQAKSTSKVKGKVITFNFIKISMPPKNKSLL